MRNTSTTSADFLRAGSGSSSGSTKSKFFSPRGAWRAVTLLPLLTLALTACETQQQLVSWKENNLATAGFTMQPANTPQPEALLRELPANQFVRRRDGDQTDYVYADPVDCKCLYVGGQTAYNQYQSNVWAPEKDLGW